MTEELMHWADQTARQVVKEKGEKKEYVVAAGITPSGTVHMGNFREIITQELVAKGLEKLGKKVRFIYSWDDYDVFRKVPVNMPKKDILIKYLRKPIVDVPDTFDCKHASYAMHNEKPVEEILPTVGIQPEFIYQNKMYRQCKYANGIKTALENASKIKDILDKKRKEPLSEDWLPVSIFCEKCGKDTISKIEYKGDYNLYYECDCGDKQEFDFRKKGIAKLLWRIDWPMRWVYETVDFESAGKDHFAAGGSRDTCAEIIEAVWKTKAPVGFMYEFIKIKGGQQFSSSKGIATTLQDVLEIYEPNMVRWLFAGTRPNGDFAISFDLDVLKIYEDFDKCERIYYDKKEAKDDKEYEKQRRIYELSAINLSKKQPFQPSFRHLTSIIQIYESDFKKIRDSYKDDLKTKEDVERLNSRVVCATNWLNKHAPEEMKFKVLDEVPKGLNLSDNQKKALHMIADKLKEKKYNEKTLFEEFYEICQNLEIKPGELFQAGYKVLLNKDRGPKLASFILILGKDRVIKMFEQV
jgi:lysyl-tRNA synthetase class 1